MDQNQTSVENKTKIPLKEKGYNIIEMLGEGKESTVFKVEQEDTRKS